MIDILYPQLNYHLFVLSMFARNMRAHSFLAKPISHKSTILSSSKVHGKIDYYNSCFMAQLFKHLMLSHFLVNYHQDMCCPKLTNYTSSNYQQHHHILLMNNEYGKLPSNIADCLSVLPQAFLYGWFHYHMHPNLQMPNCQVQPGFSSVMWDNYSKCSRMFFLMDNLFFVYTDTCYKHWYVYS